MLFSVHNYKYNLLELRNLLRKFFWSYVCFFLSVYQQKITWEHLTYKLFEWPTLIKIHLMVKLKHAQQSILNNLKVNAPFLTILVTI